MTAGSPAWQKTGLVGPVAVSGGLLLLLAAPLMRGGNRYVALIPLEILGLAILLAVSGRLVMRPPRDDATRLGTLSVLVLVLSPLLLAAIQLVPIPAHWWTALPGRAVYVETLQAVGVAVDGWRPLSVSPDTTSAALMAGIPISAAFALGYSGSLSQLRLMMGVVVAVAFAQVLFGLLQIAGGQHSPLYFGAMTYGPPIGSFANRNHYANYLAMALAAHVWLAYESYRIVKSESGRGAFHRGHRMALWVAGGLLLVLGILMSRSRGAALFGLPMAGIALALVSLRVNGWARGWKFAATVMVLLVLSAAALVGFEGATARFSSDQLANSAGFRTSLARTSLQGALAFWPWGSGWGTYDLVYPRFQPAEIAGYANHAHMDYVEMLFEGGIFFVLLALVFVLLAARRAIALAGAALQGRILDRETMAAALCGVGLLGLLLHSLVEFNMRIPANAILGALLAGVYLRPLRGHSGIA